MSYLYILLRCFASSQLENFLILAEHLEDARALETCCQQCTFPLNNFKSKNSLLFFTIRLFSSYSFLFIIKGQSGLLKFEKKFLKCYANVEHKYFITLELFYWRTKFNFFQERSQLQVFSYNFLTSNSLFLTHLNFSKF